MLTTLDEFMTPAAAYAYREVSQGGKFEFRKPLPGWRIDHVYSDGSISDYRDNGTRSARCLRQHRQGVVPIRLGRHFAQTARQLRVGPQPAIEFCERCGCGYHVVRDVWLLIYYFHTTLAHSPRTESQDFGVRPFQKAVAPVLTRVYASGTAERSFDVSDPELTLRTTTTELVEVFLPREYEGSIIPDSIAQKIRNRYRVTVRRINGTLLDFPGTPDEPMPETWPLHVEAIQEEITATKAYLEQYGAKAANEAVIAHNAAVQRDKEAQLADNTRRDD